jgi:hypothetical protein
MFKLLGRKTQEQTDSMEFKSATAANGGQYRLMSFLPAEDNFAIAWINYKQKYFIFSTSNESMNKIFDQLPK